MDSDRIGSLLKLTADGLRIFVEAQLRAAHGDNWERVARASLQPHQGQGADLDLAALATIMNAQWQSVFRKTLTVVDRGYLSELREVRNKWAHQEALPRSDAERAIDTGRRLLRNVGATVQLAHLDELTGVVHAGVVRVPVAPKPVAIAPSRRRIESRKANATDWGEAAEGLVAAFLIEFGERHRRFGTPRLGYLGVCDDAQGAQWSVYTNLHSGRTHLAVNLEGMVYDGWPIARLIERERKGPDLPGIIATMAESNRVTLTMRRDAWQGAGARPKIVEADVEGTPCALDKLTSETWLDVLSHALDCLDPLRGHRGRRRMEVTLASSDKRVEREVSPHLGFHCDVSGSHVSGWTDGLKAARRVLEPMHAFTASRSVK